MTTTDLTISDQILDRRNALLQERCEPRLRSVVGCDGVLISTIVCASGATLGAFDHQRTIDLLEEAVLSNMLLRRQLAELQAAQVMLQRQNDLREEFTSVAVHELRTPLQTLYLQTQMRLRVPRSDILSVDRNAAMMQRDERMIKNMVRLIDDIRDAARMEHGAMSILTRPMDLAHLVSRVAVGFEAQAAAAGCELSYATPDTVAGIWDEFRLEQVLGNLLTNAIR
ncbi:sensor histidine kinase KdpD, partial [Acidovorax sp. A1169]|uniref:sensor histidine kinase n=1 Tax=Acidovorax sp. A1169 TaxID=3059524 RepID=UPI00273796D9